MYTVGPMFVDYFAGSLGCNFMCTWFVALHCTKMIHYLILHLWGHKFLGKGNQRNQQTLISYKQI